jgi:hypothetical protein
MSKLTTLEDRRDALCGSNVSSACKEASDHLTWVKKHTSGVGALPWVTGAGYIAIWQRLHRAEEALIGALPPDQLPDEVLHDELRLKDSTIPNRDDLTNILRAVKQYLRDRKDDTSADPFIQSDEGAASALKEVRFSVDDFRDTSRNGLLQLRNQTMATLLLTNIVLFAFAAVAVGGGASRSAMLAATVFYLVGAGIGLFNRLNQQFQAQAGVEDYGLTTARLVAVPVYSGLAAVAGVLITAVAGTATATAPRVPDLVTVFGIPPVTGLLVVAAAFGATPALVLSRLSDAAEKFKSGITSTEPGNRG